MITKIDMDNGYFPLAKDALRTLAKTTLSGAHRALIDIVWLETIGWHDDSNQHEQKVKKRKTSSQIPHQVFIEETCMDKSAVSRKMNELVGWGVILRDKNTNPFTYSFNVNVDLWDQAIFRDTTVYRSVNGLTNVQQEFNEHTTASLTNVQQEVVRTYNCLPSQSPDTTESKPPLNNIKESFNKSSKESAIQEIFKHWNNQNIIVHRALSKNIEKAIEKALKESTEADIIQSISHFEKALHDKDYELCNYVWGLDTFLKRDRGYKQFFDDGEKWLNYQQFKADKVNPSGPGNRASPGGTKLFGGQKSELYIPPGTNSKNRLDKQNYETFVPPD